jgi:hypothetical protein
MALPPTTALRSYRIYLRDAENVLSRPHEVELASDEEARASPCGCSGSKPPIPA